MHRIVILIGRDFSGHLYVIGVRFSGIAGSSPLREAVREAENVGSIIQMVLFHPRPMDSNEHNIAIGRITAYLERSFPMVEEGAQVFEYPSSMVQAYHFRADVLEARDRVLIAFTQMLIDGIPHIPEITGLPTSVELDHGLELPDNLD